MSPVSRDEGIPDDGQFSQNSYDDFVQNDDDTAESASDDLDGKIEELYAKHQEEQQSRQTRISRPETASRSRPPSAGTSLSGDVSGDFLAQAMQSEAERETYHGRDTSQEPSNLDLARAPRAPPQQHGSGSEDEGEKVPAYGVRIDDSDEEEPIQASRSGRTTATGNKSHFVGAEQRPPKAGRVPCPSCGIPQKQTRKFCPECGTRMPQPPAKKKSPDTRRSARPQQQKREDEEAALREALSLQDQLSLQLGNRDSNGQAQLPPKQQQTPRRTPRTQSARGNRRPASARMRPWSARSSESGFNNSRPHSAMPAPTEASERSTLMASQRLDKMKKKERKSKRQSKKLMKSEQRRIEWNALHMLEEVNKWSQQLGEEKMYRAFKGTEHGAELKVHIYENGMKTREIPLDMFVKRHAMLKQKAAEQGKKRLKVDRAPKVSADENRAQSKSEIRSVLLETVQLISQLQTQLAVLKRKGGKFSPYV